MPVAVGRWGGLQVHRPAGRSAGPSGGGPHPAARLGGLPRSRADVPPAGDRFPRQAPVLRAAAPLRPSAAPLLSSAAPFLRPAAPLLPSAGALRPSAVPLRRSAAPLRPSAGPLLPSAVPRRVPGHRRSARGIASGHPRPWVACCPAAGQGGCCGLPASHLPWVHDRQVAAAAGWVCSVPTTSATRRAPSSRKASGSASRICTETCGR